MCATGLLSCLVISTGLLVEPLFSQGMLPIPGVGSQATYFSIHNIRPAHEITKGAGAKVGILDHSFGVDAHPDLYSGGEDFQIGMSGEDLRGKSHQGYWMALALKEIAPEAEIFALNTFSTNEKEKVEAMVRAIDWAIENELDAITYSSAAFSSAAKAILDPAIERALEAGIVPVFINYPHPKNINPGGMTPLSEPRGTRADLNIFQYDRTMALGEGFLALTDGSDDLAQGYRPFLSLESTAPVTAGFVAMLRSIKPDLTPGEIKNLLMASSRPMEIDGHMGRRVPDLAAAVSRVKRWANPPLVRTEPAFSSR